MSDEPIPVWAGALIEGISDLRREMMTRFDCLKTLFNHLEARLDERAKQIERELREGRTA